ncbi:MAG: MFS transporter [Enhydrobacter sp.]|nr:MAG: MFS transporter [Enhydrobacter sp.]
MNRLLLLSAAIAVGQFANSMVLPALPAVARDLGVPAGSAGLAVTAYFAGFAIVGLFVGPLSDRTGRRPLLIGGLCVLALGSLSCALAPTFAALLAFRLLEASGAAGSPVLARAIVRDTRRDSELAAALGLLATIMSVSPVVGPILGGVVTDAFGWRWLFGILAGLSLACAVSAYIAVPETLRTAVALTPRMLSRQMGFLWSRPRFRRGILFGAAFYFAFGAIYTTAPFILIEHFGLGHTQFGIAFAVMSLCLAVGGMAGPRMQSFASRPRLLELAAVIAAAAGLLLFGLVEIGQDRVYTVVAGLALFGLAFGVALSVGAALAFTDVGDAAGAASSLSGFVQIGAAAVGSAIANLLHSGSALPLAVILLATSAAAYLAIRGLQDAPPSTP